MRIWTTLMTASMLSLSAIACVQEAEEPRPYEASGMKKDTKQVLPRGPIGKPVEVDTTKSAPLEMKAPTVADAGSAIDTPATPVMPAEPDAAAPAPEPEPEPEPAPLTLTINAPPGGSYESATPEAMICSGAGELATFTVRNLSKSAVEMIWFDDVCAPQSYGEVQARGALTFTTYVTHHWRAQVQGAGVLGDFILRSPGHFEVIVK